MPSTLQWLCHSCKYICMLMFSYKFDLTTPILMIHQALVIGTNLLLSPENSILLSNMDFLSPESLCYSFDARANGYARGEGIATIVLKKVTQAVRDGDMIRAIIRSVGSNQDGKTPGLTQPSLQAQEALIRSVYEKKGLSFGTTRYFEAHGMMTGIATSIIY